MESGIAHKTEQFFRDYPKNLSIEPWLQTIHQGMLDCPKKFEYKIALIPFKLDLENYFEIELNKRKKYKLYKFKEDKVREVSECMYKSAMRAAEAGAKIIVFSELSYPLDDNSRLTERLKRICDEFDCIIIAGTYHNYKRETEDYGKNNCLIFTPYSVYPIKQAKLIRGRFFREPEMIRTPSQRTCNIIHSSYGSIMVAICADLLVKGLVDNVCVLNRLDNLYTAIDLIIVPSYTDDPNLMRKSCEDLANRTRSCVIYVCDKTYGDHSSVFIGSKKIGINYHIKEHEMRDIYIYNIDLCYIYNERERFYRHQMWAPVKQP